ncbi:MAG: hypothetical protein COZ70_05860 [Deltaproteobacteria bacterium CG_4_8_14_3_um_filter_51_11]|nr:MAG: hypothetical protein COZ70_05860 [Deltaproteobacteria bacterium CG_4_8_14_3_um_filter_51_11]PJB38644.1 MAG: hypothetical protein CO107_01820 [Deltaproteobacteria bacterium CG_4_9_14_3_um_filter_51_14]
MTYFEDKNLSPTPKSVKIAISGWTRTKKIRGRCGFSRTETVCPAPKGAPTEADYWSACPDLRKAIPRVSRYHVLSIFCQMPWTPGQSPERRTTSNLLYQQRASKANSSVITSCL